ncbi:MAG: dockerin type I repeat-containing protein [Ruminococcus sp.]|nr:dockerin type I repeat-containing protein [Ruminococcus sp.]
MIKKLFCFVLILTTIASFGIIGTCATNNSEAEKQIIYFEIPESWEGYSKVYCHVREMQGSFLAMWGSKKTLCTQTDTEGIYAFDLSKLGGISENKLYFVNFHTDVPRQRHREAIFGTDCLGDTLYCTDKIIYSPDDENHPMAYWKNQNPTKYGSYLPRNWGDVDFSLEVNIKDATAIQKYIAGIPTGKDYIIMQDPDFDCDGVITIKDATGIQKYLAGKLKLLQY